MNTWFTLTQISPDTCIFSEPRHWEQTHCYLLCGQTRALLIDTGLGISNLSAEVRTFTALPVTAALTHVHWDHIGGLWDFHDFYAHKSELSWLCGAFPLPTAAVREMLARGGTLPETFDPGTYEIFQGAPTRLLSDGDTIDLGSRVIQVLHTPGHSPGHLCYYEPARGDLYTGDLIYNGMLYANYPSTDPAAYLASIEKISALPVRRVFPGHHSVSITPERILQIRNALRELNRSGMLCHGSGPFHYESWGIYL